MAFFERSSSFIEKSLILSNKRSSRSMQLQEQINSIEDRTQKLSISDDSSEIKKEEHINFISKSKVEINRFAQLLREVLSGSREEDSIKLLDIGILGIHYEHPALNGVVYLDISTPFENLIFRSVGCVRQLLMSDKYPALHDDFEALQDVQVKLLQKYDDSSSESDSDSEGDGMDISYTIDGL